MSFKTKYHLLWLFILFSGLAQAQLDGFPLHQEFIEEARAKFSHLDSAKHTGQLPFELRDAQIQEDFFYVDSGKYYSVLKDKILHDDFIKVNEEDFRVRINPLFDLNLGTDLLDTSAYADTTRFIRNTRGIKIDGQIGKRFYFHTSFFENQATFPLWLKEISDDLGVVPSSGRHKAFGETGFDFGFSQGWLSYYPVKNLNVFFGHGKQFVGHGYRSHLLSHQSFNYPHVKYTATLLKGKLQCSWSLAALQTLERQPLGEVPESLFKRKAGSFSYINYLIGKRIQLGLFEGNTWRRYNEDTGSQPLEWRAYLPIPLAGAVSYSDSTQQLRRIGLNGQVKLTNSAALYGQYVFGENAIQAGLQVNDLVLDGLRVRMEYNQSDFSEISNNLIDFSHFNESLGHPLAGESFEEVVGVFHFQKYRLVADVTTSLIISSNKRSTLNTTLGYIINPKTNTQFIVGYLYRNHADGYTSGFLNVGLKSNVFDAFYNY